mmetsp:Transcript_33537/g.105609  ORF Transcript_33537/g.105609 Transcript_33537/m.105609 type:complete len:227 (+) Transcript_33537:570-1250(+)
MEASRFHRSWPRGSQHTASRSTGPRLTSRGRLPSPRTSCRRSGCKPSQTARRWRAARQPRPTMSRTAGGRCPPTGARAHARPPIGRWTSSRRGPSPTSKTRCGGTWPPAQQRRRRRSRCLAALASAPFPHPGSSDPQGARERARWRGPRPTRRRRALCSSARPWSRRSARAATRRRTAAWRRTTSLGRSMRWCRHSRRAARRPPTLPPLRQTPIPVFAPSRERRPS